MIATGQTTTLAKALTVGLRAAMSLSDPKVLTTQVSV